MSGIAGSVRLDGNPIVVAESTTMASAMAHRGPDGTGQWHDEAAALALCLLRIQAYAPDRPAPRLSQDGRYAIVFDGRIDNRVELANRLAEPLPGAGDDVLLLEAFRHWGHTLPEKLLGEFAFAIWDTRERELFCARDPTGARPFFYHQAPGVFLFASEDMAVAAGMGERPEPDPMCLASRLISGFRHFNVTESELAGIKKLPPGHWLLLSGGRHAQQRAYWNWDEQADKPLSCDAEYEERLRELMLQAVQCRLPTLAPATLFMSGGIDSLAVFGTMRQLEKRGSSVRLHVHSLVRDDPGCLESANLRLATCGTENSTTFIDGNHPWRPDQKDEARALVFKRPSVADLSLADMHWLARQARDADVRAVFTGISGDMAVHSPTAPLAHLVHSRGLLHAWGEGAVLAERHSLIREQGRFRILGEGLWQSGAPTHVQQAVARHRAAHRRNRAMAAAGIERTSAPWAELDARVDHTVSVWERARVTSPRAEHLFEIDRGAIQLGLEGFGSAMALHGMEHLDPWSDVRILRFGISLPLEQRVRNGWYKYLARRTFEPWLPPVVWHREKKHLGNLVMEKIHPWLVADGLAGQALPPEPLVRLLGSARARRLMRDAATHAPPPYLGSWTLSTLVWLRWLESRSTSSYSSN